MLERTLVFAAAGAAPGLLSHHAPTHLPPAPQPTALRPRRAGPGRRHKGRVVGVWSVRHVWSTPPAGLPPCGSRSSPFTHVRWHTPPRFFPAPHPLLGLPLLCRSHAVSSSPCRAPRIIDKAPTHSLARVAASTVSCVRRIPRNHGGVAYQRKQVRRQCKSPIDAGHTRPEDGAGPVAVHRSRCCTYSCTRIFICRRA